MTGHEDILMNEYLRAISSVFLTAPTNDEVMILLVRRETIKRESSVRLFASHGLADNR